MDQVLILNQCLSLLYMESKTTKFKGSSNSFVKNIIKSIKVPKKISDFDTDRQVTIGLLDTIKWVSSEIESGTDIPYSVLLQRLSVNIGADDEYKKYIEAFKDTEVKDEDDILKVIVSIKRQLHEYHNYFKFVHTLEKLKKDLLFSDNKDNWKDLIKNDMEVLLKSSTVETSSARDYIIDAVEADDVEMAQELIGRASDDVTGTKGLVSGMQLLNKMLGEAGSFRLGMFVLVGALTHNYKSGLVSDLFLAACLYNKATPKEDLPKGYSSEAIVFISAENRAEEDMMRMYVAIKERETGEPVNIKTIDKVEAGKYVYQKLTENGFKYIYMRIDPSKFGKDELIEFVLTQEAKGIRITAIYFDYLALCKKEKNNGVAGEDIRKLIQDVRVFISSKGILFVTPHQLSQEAMALKRMGVDNFLDTVAGKNYWDGSKRISNEVDLEIFADIVTYNKQAYLHIVRGKHRTIKPTPMIDRSFYQPFGEAGYLQQDLHLESPLGIRTLSNAGSVDFDTVEL